MPTKSRLTPAGMYRRESCTRPPSMCTYEPQFASDVYAMYQSVLYFDHTVPEELLWKNSPPEKVGDYDYLMEVLDWEGNIDPFFYQNRFMRPDGHQRKRRRGRLSGRVDLLPLRRCRCQAPDGGARPLRGA